MPSGEEIISPYAGNPLQPPMMRAVRGTVLVTSQRAMRARGYYERYMDLVEPSYRDSLLAITAASWVPIAIGRAHYTACDRLGLTREMILEIGAESGRFLNQTMLATLVKLSREAGVSPMVALPHSTRLITRTWEGSINAVYKLGPKEARFEWAGQPLATVPYFRLAFGGFIQGILGLFAHVVHVHELPRYRTETTIAYRCSWV